MGCNIQSDMSKWNCLDSFYCRFQNSKFHWNLFGGAGDETASYIYR